LVSLKDTKSCCVAAESIGGLMSRFPLAHSGAAASVVVVVVDEVVGGAGVEIHATTPVAVR
jgi:hypothetical protein